MQEHQVPGVLTAFQDRKVDLGGLECLDNLDGEEVLGVKATEVVLDRTDSMALVVPRAYLGQREHEVRLP